MWKDLSMQQRADLMDIYLSHGVTSLDEMRRHYDSRDIGTANAYKEGGDTNPGMTGMMKAKLATAAHFGNPTARRMTNYDTRSFTWPGEYEYDSGIGEPKRGNVFVGSYDNLVTPQIQDTGNGLSFIDNVWSPENAQRSYLQSLKFDNENDARYFGEHYKEIAPMMNLYSMGGHKIHIKPENRGKFTALKERTGHSATWFKEHGTPAQKKMAIFALNARHWKHGLGGELNNYNYGNTFGDGGLFGNKTIDTVASFLPVLGTAEDAYQFYKDPSWANAGWLALSLGSDIFTGGMASRAIKAARAANKAVDAAKAANKVAAQEFRAARSANGANHTRQSGTKVRHAIKAAGSAADNRNAAIIRANDALFDAGIKVGVDQGTNAFLNAIQLDMLPNIREHTLGGNIYDGTTEGRY